MAMDEQVQAVIVQTLNVKPAEVKLDEKLSDALGVDSTELVDLRVALEKRFGVKFESQEITKFSSPRDIIKLMESKGASS